ncbi:SET domain protein [Dictyocaulus viviparus]|uniref:SET domain protein n=1 Tax=Dictyocaulus viviparus TaxID=29172 RepID=A0A0D8XHF7_DICVI|nr:SET domain protein [Dictyocaulus viviparus]
MCFRRRQSSVNVTSGSSSSSELVVMRIGKKQLLSQSNIGLENPLELDEKKFDLHSDDLFVQLPDKVKSALLLFRRILVRSNGNIDPFPYDQNEFGKYEDESSISDLPSLSQRTIHALKSYRNSIARDGNSLIDFKENVLYSNCKTAHEIGEFSLPKPDAINGGRSQFHVDKQDLNVEPLFALGLSPAQIDRLINSPLWTPVSIEMNEDDASCQNAETNICKPKSHEKPVEQSWEVAVILRPQVIFAADLRERLIVQMASCMQQKDKQKFNELFPYFHKRHDYEYLTKCVMSFSNYREAETVGQALRLQYPEDAAGCDCKDGRCTTFCPCVRVLGRDQIRMRSTGKVNVEKLGDAITIGCGTTCSCTVDCPSRFAEKGRRVPLVVLYTVSKGWSVYTPQIISQGTFLGTYTGEHQIPGTKQYVVDASRVGNETRYFNHACGDFANLKAVSLLSRGNLLTNNMIFFTKRTVSRGEELTFSYRAKDDEKQRIGMRCLCTPGCQTLL